MKFQAPIAISALLTITGCVATYKAPTTGETSNLTIKNNTDHALWVMHYKDSYKCTGQTQIPIFDPHASKNIVVKSNSAEVFTLQTIAVNRNHVNTCLLMPSIRLEKNKNYLAEVNIHENACYFTVTEKGSEKPIDSIVMRKHTTPLVESQGFCEPLDSSK